MDNQEKGLWSCLLQNIPVMLAQLCFQHNISFSKRRTKAACVEKFSDRGGTDITLFVFMAFPEFLDKLACRSLNKPEYEYFCLKIKSRTQNKYMGTGYFDLRDRELFQGSLSLYLLLDFFTA